MVAASADAAANNSAAGTADAVAMNSAAAMADGVVSRADRGGASLVPAASSAIGARTVKP